MVQIIKIRASTEGLTMEDDAVSVLGKIGTNATLRYAVQVGRLKLYKTSNINPSFLVTDTCLYQR